MLSATRIASLPAPILGAWGISEALELLPSEPVVVNKNPSTGYSCAAPGGSVY